jgi:uncharacterized cupin superfamily protein
VEWARIPVGGVSGEHTHTRTEEVYVILSGTGEILLDGTPYAVGPGSVVLTGLGTTHGLRNTGDTPLSWLVAELHAPQTSAAFAGRPDVRPHGAAPDLDGHRTRHASSRESTVGPSRDHPPGPGHPDGPASTGRGRDGQANALRSNRRPEVRT